MIHRKKKSKFYQKQTFWLGHTLAHDAIISKEKRKQMP